MARIVISFKEKSQEEMKLHDEILKRACGDTSAYIKRVFREKFELEDYTYRIQRTKPTDEDKEEVEEEVVIEIEEQVQEEPKVKRVKRVKKVKKVKKEEAQEIKEDDSDDDDLELSDADFENLNIEPNQSKEEPKTETKTRHKTDKKPNQNVNIFECMQAFDSIKK